MEREGLNYVNSPRKRRNPLGEKPLYALARSQRASALRRPNSDALSQGCSQWHFGGAGLRWVRVDGERELRKQRKVIRLRESSPIPTLVALRDESGVRTGFR